MKVLTIKQIIDINKKIIKTENNVLNYKILEQTCSSYKHTFDGEELYPKFIDKLTVTVYSIIKNHPFVNGNKRTAFIVMLLLLKINGFEFSRKLDRSEIVKVVLDLASSKMSSDELKKFIKDNTY